MIHLNQRRPLTAPFDITLIKTRRNDMLKKLDLYANSGVNEYWIVNPFSREVYLYFFSEGGISEYRVFREKDVVQSVFFKGLEVSLEQIFEK